MQESDFTKARAAMAHESWWVFLTGGIGAWVAAMVSSVPPYNLPALQVMAFDLIISGVIIAFLRIFNLDRDLITFMPKDWINRRAIRLLEAKIFTDNNGLEGALKKLSALKAAQPPELLGRASIVLYPFTGTEYKGKELESFHMRNFEANVNMRAVDRKPPQPATDIVEEYWVSQTFTFTFEKPIVGIYAANISVGPWPRTEPNGPNPRYLSAQYFHDHCDITFLWHRSYTRRAVILFERC